MGKRTASLRLLVSFTFLDVQYPFTIVGTYAGRSSRRLKIGNHFTSQIAWGWLKNTKSLNKLTRFARRALVRFLSDVSFFFVTFLYSFIVNQHVNCSEICRRKKIQIVVHQCISFRFFIKSDYRAKNVPISS